MKIDIIHPAHYRDDGTLVQSKNLIDRLGAYLPHLGPPLMAALTPDKHEGWLVVLGLGLCGLLWGCLCCVVVCGGGVLWGVVGSKAMPTSSPCRARSCNF